MSGRASGCSHGPIGGLVESDTNAHSEVASGDRLRSISGFPFHLQTNGSPCASDGRLRRNFAAGIVEIQLLH